MDNSQTHRRTEFQSTYIGLCLPSVVLQRDPATLRGSDSYLGVDTLLRRGVHDRAALEDTCTRRGRQRGTDFRACTLRKARCHPAYGITVIGGCSIMGAETCQQSLRGAVLIPSTCGWDILAGVAMRRHREARSSHLDSRDTMLLSARKSEQCGYQRGEECLQSCWKPYLGPTSNSPSQSRRPRDLTALSRALLPLPMTPCN